MTSTNWNPTNPASVGWNPEGTESTNWDPSTGSASFALMGDPIYKMGDSRITLAGLIVGSVISGVTPTDWEADEVNSSGWNGASQQSTGWTKSDTPQSTNWALVSGLGTSWAVLNPNSTSWGNDFDARIKWDSSAYFWDDSRVTWDGIITVGAPPGTSWTKPGGQPAGWSPQTPPPTSWSSS